MAQEDATTPRGVRHRTRSMGMTAAVAGSGGPVVLGDNADPQAAHRHAQIVKDLLARVTGGKVKVMKTRIQALQRTKFILSTNAFEYEEKLRAAVRELRLPWDMERTETEGVRLNPNSLSSDGLEEGFPTLIIMRRSLYVPQTRTGCFVCVAVSIGIGSFIIACLIYWLSTLSTPN